MKRSGWIACWMVLAMTVCCNPAFGAISRMDTLRNSYFPTIENFMEGIWESIDMENLSEEGAEAFSEELFYRLENPVNLNTADEAEMRGLGLLTEWQIRAILNYRETYGEIVSWNELYTFIPTLDVRTAGLLQRMGTLGVGSDLSGAGRRQGGRKKSRHGFLVRYARPLYRTRAYEKQKYAGGPDQYLLKYTMNHQDRILLGLVAQQDAGEAFTKQGFDAYAGYLTLKNTGVLKNLTLGHYRIQWGFGLNVNASGGFYSSSAADMLQSCGAGIKPYASGAETGYLQGAAVSFRIPRGWSAEAFFSDRRLDGEIKNALIASLSEGGYHRTESEIAKKEKIRWQLFGLKAEKSFSRFRLGLTGSLYGFGGIYNPEKLRLGKGGNLSLYYQYLLPEVHLYGEYAYSTPQGFAAVQGLQWKPVETVAFTVVYHYYNRTYYSSYAEVPNTRPVTDAGGGKIRHSIEWQLRAWMAHSLRLDLQGALYRQRKFPDMPFTGYILTMNLTYEGRRIRPDLTVAYGESQTRKGLTLRARLKWNSLCGVFGESRIESRNLEKGLLLLQDIGYKTAQGRFQVGLRCALFQTTDYANRIYACEPDVLYASSAPAFYGKGGRLVLLLKYEVFRGFFLEFKYAHTLYDGVQTVGSGDNAFRGFFKPEIRAQIRYNFFFYHK